MNSNAEFVLDASALLALFFDETGAAFVHSVLYRSALSAVNYSEVLAKLIQEGADPKDASRTLHDLKLDVRPFDEDLALAGADLTPLSWTHGLSFADRACLTLARHLRVPAVTADTRWKIPGLGIKVRWIR